MASTIEPAAEGSRPKGRDRDQSGRCAVPSGRVPSQPISKEPCRKDDALGRKWPSDRAGLALASQKEGESDTKNPFQTKNQEETRQLLDVDVLFF